MTAAGPERRSREEVQKKTFEEVPKEVVEVCKGGPKRRSSTRMFQRSRELRCRERTSQREVARGGREKVMRRAREDRS